MVRFHCRAKILRLHLRVAAGSKVIARIGKQVAVQVFDIDDVSIAHQAGTLQDVPEFPNVSGERQRRQVFHGAGTERQIASRRNAGEQ